MEELTTPQKEFIFILLLLIVIAVLYHYIRKV